MIEYLPFDYAYPSFRKLTVNTYTSVPFFYILLNRLYTAKQENITKPVTEHVVKHSG